MTNKPTSATQKEILTGDGSTTFNKANDIRRDDVTQKQLTIGLADLDYTIKYYLEQVIKPTINDFGTIRPVPVLYGAQERWKNVQEDGYLRDREGKILAPIIAYKRTGITKNRTLGNKVDANHPQIYHSQQVKYSQANRYDQFSKLTGQQPVKTYVNTVMADYVDLTYDIVIWTDFVEHMNDIVESVLYSEGSFWGEENRFKFRTKVDSFTNTTDDVIDGDRIIRTTFTLTLFGYIVPDSKVKHLSDKLSDITYSPREVVVDTIVQDKPTTSPAKLAIQVTSDSAIFEMAFLSPNISKYDLYVEINGQTILTSAIKSIRQTPNNTITIDFNVEELGYTLASSDSVLVTGKNIG